MTRQERIAALKAAAKQRVLILDGSWGVMIQQRGLDEADYRGEVFKEASGQLKGDNDLLCLTRPDIIADLHDQYYAAGADISETNTFSATSIGQGEYGLQAAVRDINLRGAQIAREVADRWTAKEPQKPRFVAGSIGPLPVMLSMSSDVNDPGARKVTFEQVYDAYAEQVLALHDWAEQGIVNILGGCCGTTPDHIRHVADAVRGMKPRQIPDRSKAMRLAGLEPFELA